MFNVLNSFVDKFDPKEHQLPKLIDILINLRPLRNRKGTTISSYWSENVKSSDAKNLIKVIVKRCSENYLKRLLLSRDGNNIVTFFQFLMRSGREWPERKFSNLLENFKEIRDYSFISSFIHFLTQFSLSIKTFFTQTFPFLFINSSHFHELNTTSSVHFNKKEVECEFLWEQERTVCAV